jgi:hypothetical protein
LTVRTDPPGQGQTKKFRLQGSCSTAATESAAPRWICVNV